MKFAQCAMLFSLSAILMSACGLSEQEKKAMEKAEKDRCLDQICPGDIEPVHNFEKEAVVKRNGQWFVGPKEHFASGSGAIFYWPSKTPFTGSADGQSPYSAGEEFYDVAVEIFLRHHDGIFHGANRYEHLRKAEAEGRLVSKTTPRFGLEIWRTREIDGLGPGLWYVATDYVARDADGAVLSCRGEDPKFGRCVTAFQWRPGIAADMRFGVKHAPDWPEIYQETIRVLSLLRET